jgi:antitoxin (DNA-binding transcriptional repressor) of toxin-antitoxin stability system
MQVVNIKDLKARLSAYLRQVRQGETFLVTDRREVVARLGPVEMSTLHPDPTDAIAKLVALGARPPLRQARPTDYRRSGPKSGLSTEQIDALLEEARRESFEDER